ncbi:hypothetical protein HPB52_002677 [Rhipicephalus sanguineus]|uniref:CCHC-type domain-containing protein n=1 Tax=Rhipicephalus sanguineus TaxID=34632 RepID=A0A9D4QFX4_RHISA|nr:hypothetical protein HPB52_002677 [Rhipicephalus sanguineus]
MAEADCQVFAKTTVTTSCSRSVPHPGIGRGYCFPSDVKAGSVAARTLVFSSKCPREGGTWVVTMPPPKGHFFTVRTPLGTTVDEVIDAMEALVGIQEIYSIQHHGGFDIQVRVNSIRAVQVLLETGGLRFGTRTVPLVPVARQVASVTCLYLPCYVPDNEVVTVLKSYGTTLRIEEARYKDRPSIRTGTRYIKMDVRLENPFPNFARVGGHRATFEYRGVRRLCRRCNLEGHFKAQCDTPHCARCGVFGHRTDTCTEPCRRCGGAHASVDCTARKTHTSMRSDERQQGEGSHVEPNQAVAAGMERAADSGEGGKHGEDGASGDDEEEDDTAIAVSWASVEDTVAGESDLEGGQGDGKEDRPETGKGSQGERRLSLKGKTGPTASAAARGAWWNTKGDDDDAPRSHEVLQHVNDKNPGSSTERESPRRRQEAKMRRNTARPLPEPAPQYGGGSQQRCREGAQHGFQHGEAGGRPKREGKMAAGKLEARKAAATPSSDELEPGELVIDEHATTPPDSPHCNQQQTFPMPAGVGRGRQNRSRDPEAAHGGNRSQPLKPSSLGTDTQPGEKRPQRSTKKARRDVTGRLRGRTSGNEHEKATTKQRPSKQPVAHDIDTDSDFY